MENPAAMMLITQLMVRPSIPRILKLYDEKGEIERYDLERAVRETRNTENEEALQSRVDFYLESLEKIGLLSGGPWLYRINEERRDYLVERMKTIKNRIEKRGLRSLDFYSRAIYKGLERFFLILEGSLLQGSSFTL